MQTLPDGSSYAWTVDWGRTSPGSLSVYGTGVYDLATYDGAATIGWNAAAGFTLSVSTRRGKDAFGKRYRTGTAQVVLDNSNGRWSGDEAGFAPGDFVRMQATVAPSGAPGVTVGTFYGRVDSSTDKVRGGVDTTNVRVVGLFADWAGLDFDAVTPVGAGELSDARMERIFDYYLFDWDAVTEYGTPTNTMQATELAQPALQNGQITMDSEGGDFAELPDGTFMLGYRDWLTEATHATVVQWNLGGIGIGITQAQPSRELQLVVNDATVSNTGGVAQNSTDDVSITRFGTRTTRRLDLIGSTDAQALFLARRFTTNLAEVRPRVRSVTVMAVDEESATFCQTVKFGDLCEVAVQSINSWGSTYLAHCIGVEHAHSGTTWTTTIRLDDAFVENTDGAYDPFAYSSGYQLGPTVDSVYAFSAAASTSIETTNYEDTYVDAGFVMSCTFSASALGDAVIAGLWGDARRFALTISATEIKFEQYKTDNTQIEIVSSITPVVDTQYRCVLTWVPSTTWSLVVNGTEDTGTPEAALRFGFDEIGLGARLRATRVDFFDGWIADFVLTPTTAQAAEVVLSDTGVGNINGDTWTDQYGTDWDVTGDVIASDTP